MLSAVRASILLGAVLPELRAEAETLATDLAELVRLRTAIAADQTALAGELTALRPTSSGSPPSSRPARPGSPRPSGPSEPSGNGPRPWPARPALSKN
jgi:hypothetical protein